MQDAESFVFAKLNLASNKDKQASSATRKRLICCVLPIVSVVLILTIATGNNLSFELMYVKLYCTHRRPLGNETQSDVFA